MVNCSYCNKDVVRNIFCCPSCKVMFHRKNMKLKYTNGKQNNTGKIKSKEDSELEDGADEREIISRPHLSTHYPEKVKTTKKFSKMLNRYV